MQINRQEKSPIKQNILLYLEKTGVSPYEFYKKSGVTRGILAQNNGISEDNIARFLAYAPEVSPEWLLTGKGRMLREEEESPEMTTTSNPSKGIPLIPIEAAAGIFQGEQGVHLSDCEYYIVPLFSNADYLIPISGDSMLPHYNNGDIVACKKISPQSSFFQWGKVYIVDTEQGVLIKRVFQGETKQTITLVSDNEKYPPIEIPREEVYHIAVVLGTLRSE